MEGTHLKQQKQVRDGYYIVELRVITHTHSCPLKYGIINYPDVIFAYFALCLESLVSEQ